MPTEAAGVRLNHNGAPADVVAELLSIDETGQVVFYDDVRSLFFHFPTMQSAVSFNFDDENRSFLIIKNTTDKPQQPHITMDYDDGRDHYEVKMDAIPPQQSEVVDLLHLRDAKIPDVNGHVMPPDLKFGGSVIFSEPGGFVISDPTFVYASTTTPSVDPADNDPYFAPSCGCGVNDRTWTETIRDRPFGSTAFQSCIYCACTKSTLDLTRSEKFIERKTDGCPKGRQVQWMDSTILKDEPLSFEPCTPFMQKGSCQ